MIKAEQLTKTYDGAKAVDAVSLDISEGEVFGFVGPNGAGKTTTIGMMAGLIEPTGGRCIINGIDVTRNPREAKRITGYLPDGVGFYPHMSATDNLRYFSKFYRMDEQVARKRIVDLLEYVGLAGVNKPTGSYSRGMKQRLGLAQALLNDPQAIFMDEPTGGLDPQGVLQFRKAIKELAGKGKTIFFSSHILSEVQHVCNRIGIISKGKIVASGTLSDVRQALIKDDSYTIIIKVAGQMPRLTDSHIIEATYGSDCAMIRASADIRDPISDELYRSGARVTELKLEERSLEDVFLDTVYRGD